MLKTAAILFGVSLLFAEPASSQDCPARSAPLEQSRRPLSAVDVGEIWTGTKVNFGAVSTPGHVFVGYFGPDRTMRVTDIGSAAIKTTQLPSRFNGWDSHNDVTLTADKGGLLHLAGNMHATPLQYFQVDPRTLTGQPSAMLGRDEQHVTYPTFLHGADGGLIFFYRSGVSGNGTWIANAWDGRRWSRVNSDLFGSTGFGGPVSAYPSAFTRSRDGYLHVAIVWRAAPDADGNVEVSYAKTRDFRQWVGTGGQQLRAPLTPETAERVIHTGRDAGLIGAQIAVAPDGSPVISFTGYDEEGRNVIRVATHRRGPDWSVVTVAKSDQRFRIQGQGAIAIPVSVAPVNFSNPEAPVIRYALPGLARQALLLDPRTFRPAGCPMVEAPEAALRYADRPADLTSPSLRYTPVQSTDGAATDKMLVWATRPPRGDVAPKCPPDPESTCHPPPAILRLVIPSN